MVAFTAQNSAYARYDIGEWTYGTPAVGSWGEGACLKIGRFCSIANNVVILLGGEHRIDWVTTYPFSAIFREAAHFSGHPRGKGDITIGNDVWVGMGALILSGVAIGNGAVIGAASVVTKDVAPYSIVAGNPARHVRYPFSERQIEALEKIQWRNWPLDRIATAWPDLLSDDVDGFVAKHGGLAAGEAERDAALV